MSALQTIIPNTPENADAYRRGREYNQRVLAENHAGQRVDHRLRMARKRVRPPGSGWFFRQMQQTKPL